MIIQQVNQSGALPVQLQVLQLSVGPGRHAVDGRFIAVEHRDRHPLTGRHGDHRILFVFRDADDGLAQHAVRSQGDQASSGPHRRSRDRSRIRSTHGGDPGRSRMVNQAMKRPRGEKPCGRVSPIASITCHPRSTFGALPASAKETLENPVSRAIGAQRSQEGVWAADRFSRASSSQMITGRSTNLSPELISG